MRKFLEYFDELEQIEYPLKCKVIGYRVKFGECLLCGSFVLPRNRKRETRSLGFNLTTPFYGYGSQVNSKKALVFLTRSDAQSFCEKYMPNDISSMNIYPSNVMDELVRIDEDLDIPVYMSQTQVRYEDRVKLSTTAITAIDAELTPIDNMANLIPSELLDKIKRALKKREKRDLIDSFMPAIREQLQGLGQFSVDTPLGNVTYTLAVSSRNVTNARYEVAIGVHPEIIFGKQESRDIRDLMIYPSITLHDWRDSYDLRNEYNRVPRSENPTINDMIGPHLIFARDQEQCPGDYYGESPVIIFQMIRDFSTRPICHLNLLDIYKQINDRFGEVTQHNFVQKIISLVNELIPAFNEQLLKSVDHMQDVAEQHAEVENGDEIVRLTYADFE